MNIEDKAYFAVSPAETEKKIRDLTAAWRKLMNVADNLHGMANPSPEIMKRQDQVDADMERIGNQIAELKKSIGVQENVSVRLAKPVEDKAYFDGGYFRTAATPLSLFTKDLRETLRRFAAIVNCPIKGFGNLTTQNEFTSKINQLKTWIAADIAKMENDKLKETFPAMAIHRHHWIKDRKEVIAELKKIEDTKISLLPTVAKNAMPVEDKTYFDRRIYHSTGTFHTLLDKETRVPIDGTSKWVTVDPAQYITPRRVRISGIKGEIEIAAQLSGDEIKGISAKAVKATAARQGSKAVFDKEWTEAGFSASFFIKKLQGMMAVYQGENDNEYRNKIIGYAKTLANHPDFVFNGVSSQALAKKAFTLVKFKYARTGTKAKFAATRIWPNDYGEINNANAKYARLIFDRQKIIRANAGRRIKGEQPLEVPSPPTAPEFPFAFADGDYVGLVLGGQANVPKGATVKWAHNANSIKMSRTGTKAKFASDTNYAHKNTIKIKGKSDKIYALIYAEEGYGDNLTGFWNGHVQNNSNPKVNDVVTIGQFKSKEAAKAAAIKALKQEEQGTNFSKAKFANRGAFAEASSSPVLGSLLEKKVMPEGGWRAVETDGSALIIAFEDNDIAGNFARRASENGYSATAPMAMAGRFWNVKVQNENKQ